MNIHEEVAKAILEGGDWWEDFEWHHEDDRGWYPCMSAEGVLYSLAGPRFTLRKKKKFITINGIEVPEPVREPLEEGDYFWIADISVDSVANWNWAGDSTDYRWLKAGIIHLSEEDAQAHYDALIKANNP